MNIDPINFGKKYISKANVIDNSTKDKVKMDFVEYEHDGKDLLKVVQTNRIWEEVYNENNTYIGSIAADFYETVTGKGMHSNRHFYGIEDEDGQIQAIMETSDYDGTKRVYETYKKPTTLIKYISTNPKSMHKKQNREYSKLGTSLFNSLLKHFRKEKREIVLEDTSRGFWDSIPNMKTKYQGTLKVCHLAKSNQQNTIAILDKKI